jgi:hypothetical protein
VRSIAQNSDRRRRVYTVNSRKIHFSAVPGMFLCTFRWTVKSIRACCCARLNVVEKDLFAGAQRLAPNQNGVSARAAGERFRPNRFRIPEPRIDARKQRKIWALDLILMPLVGFDDKGGRLGMGGGFYDRSLAYQARRKAWQKPVLLGLAHECQKVEKLAVASWDVPLQGTVSDKRWYLA